MDLKDIFKAKMVKQPSGLWQAFCTCEEYKTNKYVRPSSAAKMINRHLEYHVDRMRAAWPAVVRLVGLRRVAGETKIQVLITVARMEGRGTPCPPVVKLDLTADQARELADQLNDFADEMERD